MDEKEARCDTLIEETAAALNDDVVALMLVSVQKDNNLGLSANLALKRSVHRFKGSVAGNFIRLCRVYSRGGFNKLDTITIVRGCVFPFPYLWASVHLAFIVAHAMIVNVAPCPIHRWCVLALCFVERLT